MTLFSFFFSPPKNSFRQILGYTRDVFGANKMSSVVAGRFHVGRIRFGHAFKLYAAIFALDLLVYAGPGRNHVIYSTARPYVVTPYFAFFLSRYCFSRRDFVDRDETALMIFTNRVLFPIHSQRISYSVRENALIRT